MSEKKNMQKMRIIRIWPLTNIKLTQFYGQHTIKINVENSLKSTLNDMHNSYIKHNNKTNTFLHENTHTSLSVG